MTPINFPVFATLWNQSQSMGTPKIHYRIMQWLENRWHNGDTRLLLMAFRSCGKSTLVGLFCAWLLFKNPDLRILVLAADTTLAKKMVRNVKRIIERHPLTKHLKPQKPEQWASAYFTVQRPTELRDPSMLARGITANITGSRADIIICDDVEVPNTCDTAGKRTELRDRLSEIEYILISGGSQIYVGTPHTYHSIYKQEPSPELDEDYALLENYQRLAVPIHDAQNKIAWPERYDWDDINRMKRQTGPAKFTSQMLLKPVKIIDSRLDAKDLQIYKENINYCESAQKPILKIGDTVMTGAAAWWDPSFGSASGDGSVLACLFTDDSGNYYLHHLAMITNEAPQNTTQDSMSDPATIQCNKVAQILRANHMPSVHVETNGIGKFLPAILRRELAKTATKCAVKEVTSRTNKDQRILESFDVVLAARALHVHKTVLKTPFVTEMQEWQPGKSSGHDDTLDAVAGAIATQPVRIQRIYANGGAPNWQGSSNNHTAQTNFKILN